MTMFKEMVQGIVDEAKAEVSLQKVVEDRNYHSVIDKFVSSYNDITEFHSDNFRKASARTLDRVTNSASYTDNDRYYASSSSEMYRERRLENKWNRSSNSLSDDSRFDYLCKSAGIVENVKRDKAVAKKFKSLPKATYIPSKPTVTGKESKPNADVNTFKILDYKIYHKAIVLEIVDADIERNEYIERNTHEVNVLTQHLVFRYQPFTRAGKPNPYDGIMQLQNFLKGFKFITESKPSTIKEALEILKGYTVNLPNAMAFNYSGSDNCNIITKDGEHKKVNTKTGKADNLTVYTVFGDFDEFERQFANE